MAEVNVENMEENAELFIEKMGFAHDSEGLDMTDDQLVNFLLLCHQMQHGIGDEYEEEESILSEIKPYRKRFEDTKISDENDP